MMDVALDRARLGERWVVRHRLADRSATDVVGWLSALDPGSVVLELEGGTPVTIDRSTIVLARRAPAARGGPDPGRTSAAELEWAALPGWLALSEPLGQWTLRAGGGFTGRANSALAVGDPGVTLDEAAARVVAFARQHQIPPWAQVIVGSEEDTELARRGWRPVYVTTDVLVCRLTTLLGQDLPDDRIRVGDQLAESWWRAYARSRPNTADPDLLRMILDGHPPRAFASMTTGPGPAEAVAIARGHVSGPWLGLAAIWTDPGWRRQGLATAMVRALGHWGARQGARNAYLQVAQQNVDAHVAYGRLGFVPHHSYRYLTAPG